MATLKNPNDTVTVAPSVLLTIVHIATLNVEGVARMGSTTAGVDRLLRRGATHEGVRIDVEGDGVRVDVYIVADATFSLFETSRQVQEEVVRTIKEYVGMKVLAVNVHIENVVFGKDKEK
jgi:uncharacterized alkaline shock family protein YloU